MDRIWDKEKNRNSGRLIFCLNNLKNGAAIYWKGESWDKIEFVRGQAAGSVNLVQRKAQ
jgi:hypothetical protein